MPPRYPSTISEPHASGFSIAPKKTKVSYEPINGASRQRRFVSAQLYVLTMQFDFNSTAEFNEFSKWFKYDIDNGNLWFSADWLASLGFTAGDWVFRFVNDPFSATGYSMGHSCTIVMGPRNANFVTTDFVELGIQSFLNQYTEIGCSEFTYYRTFVYSYLGQTLQTLDYNGDGLNWTPIGNSFSLASPTAMTNTRSICAMKADCVALINGTAGTGSFLRMMQFDGTDFTQLGTGTSIAPHSTQATAICRMSDTRIALLDGALKTLTVYDFDYTSNTWSQVGISFNMASYYWYASPTAERGAITALSSSRVAVVMNYTFKLLTLDFNGSTWSVNGTPLVLYTGADGSAGADFSISAIASDKIVLTHDNGTGIANTYKLRYTQFTFASGAWTAGTPSAQFTTGGFPVVCAMSLDKIGSIRAGSSNMKEIAVDVTAGAFTDLGNPIDTSSGANQDSKITSYFLPV